MRKSIFILMALIHCFGCACSVLAAEEETLRSELSELKQMMKNVSSRMEQIETRLQVLEGGEGATVSAKGDSKFGSGPKTGTVYAAKGWLLNPDISLIANTNYFFRDGAAVEFGEFEAEELNVSEVELDLASYIYPGVRAWSTIAYEPEEEKVEVEEAYVNFEALPFNSSATLGRRFIDFGLVNPIHQHFRPYTDSPLAVTQLFGEVFVDDGFLYSVLLPTPGKLTAQVKAGLYDGRKELVEAAGLEFGGHILHLGADLNHPLGDDADISLGYDVLLDDFSGKELALHAVSSAFRYYVPESEQKILWQNEVYAVTGDDVEEPVGFYSLLRYSLNRYWDAGVRFDWTELLSDDSDTAWAVVPSLTWNITESTYARAQYRHIDVDEVGDADEFWLQFVFGFGPHSHRLDF